MMKKAVLFLFVLSSAPSLFGQDTQSLIADFAKQRVENQSKLQKFLKVDSLNSKTSYFENKGSYLADFSPSGRPVFYDVEDARANNTSRVPALQNGSFLGLNGSQIQGEGIKIIVMDEGRVFEKHREFGAGANGVVTIPRIFDKESGTVGYNSHATTVASMLGAQGILNHPTYGNSGAKGVLPKTQIDTYAFRVTAAGSNFEKLLAAENANISNHSYGTNLGWFKVNTASADYPTVGWYWYGNYTLNALDTYSGSYNTNDQNFDKLVYSNPNHVIVKSTGNYFGLGPSAGENAYYWDESATKYVLFQTNQTLPSSNCSNGYYCIGWGSLAKNVISVGAIEQLTTSGNEYTSPSDVVKWGKSSAGPRKDGAIKPDLVAVGANVYVATYNSGTNYTSQGLAEGTSFAAPVVSGIAGAVTEIKRILSNNPSFSYKGDEVKALLTHTALEAGNPGPDVWYGWGLVDAQGAAKVLVDQQEEKSFFERISLSQNAIYSKEVFGKSGEPLKVTISWIDPAATPFTTDEDLQNNHASRLVNDLDLRITDTTTNEIYFPWKLDVLNPMNNATKGDNLVDNVEQVVLENPVAGRRYKIEVSHKGSLLNENGGLTNQYFAMVATGLGEESTMGTQGIDANKVYVYPTRSSSSISVILKESAKDIQIVDMKGGSVLKIKPNTYQTIDVSKLPVGVYLVKIALENEIVVKKIIKQ